MVESHRTINVKSPDGHVLAVNYDAFISNKFFFDMLEGQDVPTETLVLDQEYLKKSVLENVMTYCDFAYKNLPPKI